MGKFNKVQIFLAVLLLIFLKNQLASQTFDRFGFNLILSASKQDVRGIPDYYEGYPNYRFNSNNIYGMGIGMFFEAYRTKLLSLNLNIEYVQRGSELYVLIPNSIESYADEVKMYNRLGYLSAPIDVKVFITRNNFSPYITCGLKLNYLIEYYSEYLEPYYKNANIFTCEALFGVGCEIKFSDYISLFPSLIYNYDFNNAIDYRNLQFKNKSLDFSLGIKI